MVSNVCAGRLQLILVKGGKAYASMKSQKYYVCVHLEQETGEVCMTSVAAKAGQGGCWTRWLLDKVAAGQGGCWPHVAAMLYIAGLFKSWTGVRCWRYHLYPCTSVLDAPRENCIQILLASETIDDNYMFSVWPHCEYT